MLHTLLLPLYLYLETLVCCKQSISIMESSKYGLSADMDSAGFDKTAATTPNAQQQQNAAKNEEYRQQMEENRRIMMRSLLSNDALERLNRIGLVKPQKVRMVEDVILQNARLGRLAGKLEDKDLISILNNISDTVGSSGPKITIQRRRDFDEDD